MKIIVLLFGSIFVCLQVANAQNYIYDHQSRLTVISYSNLSISYTYDKLGNRTTTTRTSSTPLPVGIVSFTGNILQCQSQLCWRLSSLWGVGTVELQRSIDGRAFTSIAKWQGSDVESNTTFIDQAPIIGDNLYRLELVGHGGIKSYSNVLRLFNGCGIIGDASISPNPTSEKLILHTNAGKAIPNAEFYILDVNGRPVLFASLTIVTGKSALDFDIRSLAPGTYAYVLRLGNSVLYQGKFAKR